MMHPCNMEVTGTHGTDDELTIPLMPTRLDDDRPTEKLDGAPSPTPSTGLAAFRRACLMTTRGSEAPFAQAVRM